MLLGIRVDDSPRERKFVDNKNELKTASCRRDENRLRRIATIIFKYL